MRSFVETKAVYVYSHSCCFVWGEDKRHVDAYTAIVEQTGCQEEHEAIEFKVGQYIITF